MLFIPLQRSMTHTLWHWHWHTQTTRRSDRSFAVMCVCGRDPLTHIGGRPGSGDEEVAYALFCWLSKQQRGQSEWKRPREVTSSRDTCHDSECLIMRIFLPTSWSVRLFVISQKSVWLLLYKMQLCYLMSVQCLCCLLLPLATFTTLTLMCGFECVIPLQTL